MCNNNNINVICVMWNIININDNVINVWYYY